MPRTVKLRVVLWIWILGFGASAQAQTLNEILNIRHWVAPDHTRIVIDTSAEPVFSVEKEARKISVRLEEASLPAHLPRRIVLNKPGMEEILLSSREVSGIGIEITLPAPLQSHVFKLKKFQDKPDRIVVDITLPDAMERQRSVREQMKTATKSRVIVIDPGHGGEAPGAVGRKGTLEKAVALEIAMNLKKALNLKEGYRAFLTRDDDYYVSFKKRLMVAREYGADLFISIHADAARSRAARGSSVYCLSTGAASSEAAKILAQKENLADIVGGVADGEGNDASDPIILDMFQTHTINQSKSFGALLLKELGRVNTLKFATVQEAPFRVLKLPEIPSILIETAFISNEKEESLLRSKRFQVRIAESVARSVIDFLPPLTGGGATGASREGEVRSVGGVTAAATGSAVNAGQQGSSPEGKGPVRSVQEERSHAPGAAPAAAEAGTKSAAAKSGPEGKGPVRSVQEERSHAPGAAPAAAEAGTKSAAAKSSPEEKGPVRSVQEERSHAPGATPAVVKVGKKPAAAKSAPENNVQTGSVQKERSSTPKASAATDKPPKNKRADKERAIGPNHRATPRSSYRVKKGDTLGAIAARFGTTTRALSDLNELKRPDHLWVGRRLLLPGQGSATGEGRRR